MKLVLGYHTHSVVKKVIENEITKLGLYFTFTNSGQIEILNQLSNKQYEQLKSNFLEYGIFIQENQKEQLVQRIKDVVDEYILSEDSYKFKTSQYISERLNLSYGYISNLFSEETLTTLGNYIMLKKIEHAKTMILSGEYNLTEIAFRLNYSSVGHLSSQFKKITGLTSSAFIRIISRRNGLLLQN
ncbi:helix-turn-helix domain-containing protein [Pararhodonellum marinum]|uniref:helix-turn-helix domain-containing protein n=1 Tax=Pararhodonellum marinum TaxID=2755358 RepID=UPI00188F329C|nr:AraC family transcriptional regulator [Pararhodonellum marinum]